MEPRHRSYTARRAKPSRESYVNMYPSAPLGYNPRLKLLVERSRDENINVHTPIPRLRSVSTRLRTGYTPK